MSQTETETVTTEDASKARQHGFGAPMPYNYTAYGADSSNTNAPVSEIDESALASTQDASGPAWLAGAVKYEWDDEYGEVGPRNEKLEQILFHGELRMRKGTLLDAYQIEVTIEGEHEIAPFQKFSDAGLHPTMMENARLCGYHEPTPIQAYTIPAILLGFDVIASAQTGSGKTAAYLIPVLSKLMGKTSKLIAPRPNPRTYNPETDRVRAEPLVLVVCPSRELACQIYDEARRLCYRTQLRPCVVYGGCPTRIQRDELERGCDVLIATPGRLRDFMEKPNLLTLNRVKFTIIDEADELLQTDWEEDLGAIMNGGDTNEDADHLYAMFSATFPKAARAIAREYMAQDHVRIRVGRAGSTHTNVTQNVIWTDDSSKRQALYDMLFSIPPGRTIIFVNSKREADNLDDYLYSKQLPCTSMHADRTQLEREDAIRAFRKGTCCILVTTGVTARGIDIQAVQHVINYDLPSTAHGGIEEYVHRIGRTARIGNRGLATSFYNERNEDIAEDLVKILLESKQKVPDFLQSYVTENVEFDDATEASDDAAVPDTEANNDGTTGWD